MEFREEELVSCPYFPLRLPAVLVGNTDLESSIPAVRFPISSIYNLAVAQVPLKKITYINVILILQTIPCADVLNIHMGFIQGESCTLCIPHKALMVGHCCYLQLPSAHARTTTCENTWEGLGEVKWGWVT